MTRSPQARLTLRLAALSLAAAVGCLPDTWVTVSPTLVRDGSAPELSTVDAAEPVEVAEAEVATRPAACAEAGVLECPDGQIRCGGACVGGPRALYRGEDPSCMTGGDRPTAEQVEHADGRWGRAYDFGGDARPGQVALPASVSAFGGGDFTLSLWFRTSFADRVQSFISNRLACWTSAAFTGYDLRMAESGLLFAEVWTSGGLHTLRTSTGFNDGRWHHFAMIREGPALRIAVDAVVEVTVSIRGSFTPPATTPTYLGVGRCVPGAPGNNGTHDETHWFTGLLDEVGFFARALSSEELAATLDGRCGP